MTAPTAASTATQHIKRGGELPSHTPHAATSVWTDDTKLNDIKAEIFDGRVRVIALLDTRGLDKLERKIKALRVLITDDDEEMVEQLEVRDNDELACGGWNRPRPARAADEATG